MAHSVGDTDQRNLVAQKAHLTYDPAWRPPQDPARSGLGPWLAGRLPASVSRTVRKAMRFRQSWRDYRDGWLFDLFEREYRTEGLEFEVPRNHTRLRDRARFRTDTHESHERRLIKEYLPADGSVLELGACLGVVSCVVNRLLVDRTRHVAVEPNRELIPVLTRNRDRNAASFHIVQALVSSHSKGAFYVADCPTTSSADKASGRMVQVPVVTVPQLEATHGLRFDTLVMDIQGGERAFFLENPEVLERCRCVILEQHPHIIGPEGAEEVRARLRTGGLHRIATSGLVEAWRR